MNSGCQYGCAVILALISFSSCIALSNSNPPFLFGFLAVLFVFACFVWSITMFVTASETSDEEKKAELDQERRAIEMQKEKQRRSEEDLKKQIRSGAEPSLLYALKTELSSRLDGDLIIDTCALMDCETSSGKNVFNALKELCTDNKSKIIILPEVFEELTKHRKGDDSEKQIHAQAAKRLLLDFQKCHIMQSPDGAYGFPNQSQSFYADKAIAKYMLDCFKNGRKAYLITADVDLTIRIINMLENENFRPSEKTIVSLKELFQAAANQKGFSNIVHNGMIHCVDTIEDGFGNFIRRKEYDI